MAQEGDKAGLPITDAMVQAAADIIEDSPWFEGLRPMAERLAAQVLAAAMSCRTTPES